MIPLTIQILVQNHESQIEQTLRSIKSLNAQILIGNLGSKDRTLTICERYKCQIIPISLNDDYAQARNFAAQKSRNAWNLYLLPGETLLQGSNELDKILTSEPDIYKIQIISGDVITKSNRIWHSKTKAVFINPIFEYLSGKGKASEIYVASDDSLGQLNAKILEKWMLSNPLGIEPLYYKACVCLKEKNYDAFLNYADLYFLQEKSQSMSFVMANYYYSMVHCYIKKDYHKAFQYLLPCLSLRPSMAEFWCLYGDIYYETKKYDKAIELYENAMIAGQKRLNDDDYPIEITKYHDYPAKMIEACRKILKASKFYVQN